MPSVCIYLQVHQPYRLRRYSVFDTDRHYFDDAANADACRRAAADCYLPVGRALLDAVRRHDGRFRFAMSVTGSALEQFERFAPDVLELLQQLNATGAVEFLSETYHHSLAFLYSREEFRAQVDQHRAMVKRLFGQDTRVFRNTELIYNNDLAHFVSHMGFDAVIAEGVAPVLGYRDANAVYRPPHSPRLKLLLTNDSATDEVAIHFGDKSWEGYPLTAERFARSVDGAGGQVCNLFLDMETLGEPAWAEAGILDFIGRLPGEVLKGPDADFVTPSQAVDRYDAAAEVDVPSMTSWADADHDLSAWLGNAMQSNALHELYKVEGPLKERADPDLLADWRRLTASDHFFYMCTKYWADPAGRHHFSPYESPYDSYINFMNVLDNVQSRLRS